jgi:hypothetical protein
MAAMGGSWNPDFHRPLSDSSTDVQVRCHGSERDGRDVPIPDVQPLKLECSVTRGALQFSFDLAFGGDQSSTTPASIRAQPKREIALEGEHFAKIECRSPERGAYGIAGHITYARRVPQSTTHGGFKMPT